MREPIISIIIIINADIKVALSHCCCRATVQTTESMSHNCRKHRQYTSNNSSETNQSTTFPDVMDTQIFNDLKIAKFNRNYKFCAFMQSINSVLYVRC